MSSGSSLFKRLIIIFICTLTCGYSFGQSKIDSLKRLIPQYQDSPSQLLSLYLTLAEEYYLDTLFQEEIYNVQEAILLANSLSDTLSIARAHQLAGKIFYRQAQTDTSLVLFQRAKELYAAAGNTIGEARSTLFLSEWYFDRGAYTEALSLGNLAHEQLLQNGRPKPEMAKVLSILCCTYQALSQYEPAVQFCAVAIAAAEELQQENDLAKAYRAMANLYLGVGNQERTLDLSQELVNLSAQSTRLEVDFNQLMITGDLAFYNQEWGAAATAYQAAINTLKSSNSNLLRMQAHIALGRALMEQLEYRKAGDEFYVAISYAPDLADESLSGVAHAYLAVCKLNSSQSGAHSLIAKALEVAKTADPLAQVQIYQSAGEFFKKVNQLDSAIYYFQTYDNLRQENLYNQMNSRLGSEFANFQMQYYDRESERLAEMEASFLQRGFSQKVQIYALLAGILAIGLITGVLYKRYTVKNRATEALERQTESINRQKEEILAQRNEISRKNRRMEEQNAHITNSIQYARDIQMAMLPEESELRTFFPESFIFNAPRAIVSGDIFLFGRLGHRMVLALVDCTGHGVPGAFLTVLVNNLLNQLVLEQQMHNPAEIVTLLDEKVQKTLRSQPNNNQSNSMDIALMVVDSETRWLEFTGAKMPLYYVHNYSLVQIKGDRFSVGSTDTDEKFFTRQRIKLQEGDYIYMATDGFQNQFGGKDGKKFMKTQFRRLLNSLSTLPMANQKAVLEQRFDSWKGDQSQTDDVLVVGLQL